MDWLYTLDGATGTERLAAARRSGLGLGADGARVPTGLHYVDMVTGGGLTAGVHLICGPPGVGRTGFLVRCSLTSALGGLPVVWVSHPSEATGVAQRMVSAEARVPSQDLGTAAVELRERVELAERSLAGAPVVQVVRDRIEPWAIAWAVRELSATAGRPVRLVAIDDLDVLIRRRTDELERTLSTLSDMALNLGVALVVSMTLTRGGGGGSGSPSALPDLGEWPGLKPYLRTIWVVHRPWEDEDGTADESVGELQLVWHPNGPTGTVRLAFLTHLAAWANLGRASH